MMYVVEVNFYNETFGHTKMSSLKIETPQAALSSMKALTKGPYGCLDWYKPEKDPSLGLCARRAFVDGGMFEIVILSETTFNYISPNLP